MGKILDAQVRKNLFATMKENGFTQNEITEIIGNKFKSELEGLLKEAILTLDKGLAEENYDLMALTVSDDNEWNIKNLIAELVKVRKQLGINSQKLKQPSNKAVDITPAPKKETDNITTANDSSQGLLQDASETQNVSEK